jgi:hypothetical protein
VLLLPTAAAATGEEKVEFSPKVVFDTVNAAVGSVVAKITANLKDDQVGVVLCAVVLLYGSRCDTMVDRVLSVDLQSIADVLAVGAQTVGRLSTISMAMGGASKCLPAVVQRVIIVTSAPLLCCCCQVMTSSPSATCQ